MSELMARAAEEIRQRDAPQLEAQTNVENFDQQNKGIVPTVKNFLGLGDVLPEVQNAPKEYQDLRKSQLENKGFANSPAAKMIAGGITETYKDTVLQGEADKHIQDLIDQGIENIKRAEERKKANPDKAAMYDKFIENTKKNNADLVSQAGGEIKDKTTGQLVGQSLSTAAEISQVIPIEALFSQGAKFLTKEGIEVSSKEVAKLLADNGLKEGGEEASKFLAEKGIAPVKNTLLKGEKLLSTKGITNLATNKSVVENTLYGGVFGAGGAMEEKKSPTEVLGQTEAGMGLGFLMGAGLPPVISLVSKGLSKITKGVIGKFSGKVDKLAVEETAKDLEKAFGKKPNADDMAEIENAFAHGANRDEIVNHIKQTAEAPGVKVVPEPPVAETPKAISETPPQITTDANGSSIERNSLGEVAKITDKEGKIIYENPTQVAPEAPKLTQEAVPEQKGINPPVEQKPAVEPLIQEARKGEVLYHGGSKIDEVKLGKGNFSKTFYMSDDPDYAKSFGGKNSVVNKMELSPNANLADMRKPSNDLINKIDEIANGTSTGKTLKIQRPNGSFVNVPETPKDSVSFHPYSKEQVIQGLRDGKANFAELPEVKKILKDLGYDGQITSEVPYAKNVGIWNKDVVKKSKSLQEGVSESMATSNPSKMPTVEGTGQLKTRKASETLQGNLESKGIGGAKPEQYRQAVHSERNPNADELVKTDKELAKQVALGNTHIDGVIPEDVLAAITRSGDKELIAEVATNTSLINDATEMGRRIEAWKQMNVDNPVRVISDVTKDRVKSVGEKKITATVDKLKTETKVKLKLETAQSLLDKLIC
jgi:hypothetical protein